MDEIKYSPKTDIGITNLRDLVPERMIKVYPYEMPNTEKSKAFIAGQTTSVVYITQNNVGIDNEGNDDEHIKTDENGDKYFEIFAAITSDGILDFSSSTSVYGQELKEEDSFTALSNWFYEGELEDIKLGHLRFMPCMFTIGRAYNMDDYETGDQAVFLSTGMIEAQEGQAQYTLTEMDTEGLYEFQLINATSLEASFTNARIIFTPYDVKHDILTPDGDNGIRMSVENHTLLHAIKGRGRTSQIINGAEKVSEFSDLELISKEKLTPFKFTPVSVQDKVTLYADWFDYDTVLPFIFAKEFKTDSTLDNVVTNPDDRKMIEDMLVISQGFANSWADAPRDATGENAGKIQTNFRVGWAGMKVQALEGKDPVKVVDGIYEAHIRKFPLFTQTPERYQPAREILNALSRYIYSSYCIGKGQNAYNQAYLPWYLIPSSLTKIETQEDKDITNPDYGVAGKVTSFRLKDGTKFKIESNYFKTNYSDDINLKKGHDLVIPDGINMSNLKLLQTDRKLVLPELPYSVTGMNKLPLPGDINTASSDDLAYIFYLPIQDQANFENLFVDQSSQTSVMPAGTRVDVLVPDSTGRGVDGRIWQQGVANAHALSTQPGTLVTPPTLSQVERKMAIEISSYFNHGHQAGRIKVDGKIIYDSAGTAPANWHIAGQGYTEISQEQIQGAIQKLFGFINEASIRVIDHSLKITHSGRGLSSGTTISGSFEAWVSHTEFSPAVVEIKGTQAIRTYGIAGREILFDKQQWKSFLSEFQISPNWNVTYDLFERKNFKIKELEELTISSMWGNYLELQFGNHGKYLNIPLFNKDDETVSEQRILFT